MKQIVQHLATGETALVTSPVPRIGAGDVLINARVSLLSAGTERMLVGFGKASYLSKAKQQPEKVKQVLHKMKTDGVFATLEAVKSKLDQPIPLGYCHVGVVAAVGAGVKHLKPGDRVVSNAPHADVVKVAKQLCVRIPDEVDDDMAVFTVVASIALQGIRNVQPTLGEAIVVMGVGLIGLLTVQLLKAQGCRVLAIDFDAEKLAMAAQFGAEICQLTTGEDIQQAANTFSRGHGVDAVIIAATTDSNDPVSQAAMMCRKRGRIVLVGVTGLTLNRADFYQKELTFQVSCSYGPGRYEAAYESTGLDYPIGFVRWTEARNFEACLDLMASGRLNLWPLITQRFVFEDAVRAYECLMNEPSSLGLLLDYISADEERHEHQVILDGPRRLTPKKPVVGMVGAGQYASRQLIPALKKASVQCDTLVTLGGVNTVFQGKLGGFRAVSTDVEAMLSEPSINTVIIATRHDSHPSLVIEALAAEKHVFVEKPLALDEASLSAVESTCQLVKAQGKIPHLMVGFNRRFSPHAQKMKVLLKAVDAPKSFIITVNAGAIPESHWSQDPSIGGGRIVGEACHFIDLMRFLADSAITSVYASSMGRHASNELTDDKASITLHFEDGSFGTIHYFANGARQFPKERIEVFTAGRVLQLDNFRTLKGFSWPAFKHFRTRKQDKGQQACINAFLAVIESGCDALIPLEELFEISRASIQAAQQICRMPEEVHHTNLHTTIKATEPA